MIMTFCVKFKIIKIFLCNRILKYTVMITNVQLKQTLQFILLEQIMTAQFILGLS